MAAAGGGLKKDRSDFCVMAGCPLPLWPLGRAGDLAGRESEDMLFRKKTGSILPRAKGRAKEGLEKEGLEKEGVEKEGVERKWVGGKEGQEPVSRVAHSTKCM